MRPAGNTCTCVGSKLVPRGGPVVRNTSPAQLLPVESTAQLGTTYHTGLPKPSYTYQAANITEACCVIAMPQPGSSGLRQRSVSLICGAGPVEIGSRWIATVRAIPPTM